MLYCSWGHICLQRVSVQRRDTEGVCVVLTSETKVMVKDYRSLVNDLLGSANFTAVVKNPHQRPHLKSGVSGLLLLHH